MDKTSAKSSALQRQESGQPERVTQRPSVTPRVDIFENDQEVLLIADLPGVSNNNLHINLDNEQLTIEGTREEHVKGTALASEFRDTDYHRTFLVPQGIDVDKIRAELRQGVLHLHLPKSEALRPRQITVTAGK